MKKIIITITGLLLLLFVVSAINSFNGNSISKLLAKNAARRYVEEQYSNLDLEVKKVYYNFKFKHYGVVVQSETSEDTYFTIYTDGLGNIDYDDYENSVVNNFNTWIRLNMELDERANEIISSELNYTFDKISIQFLETSKEDQDLSKLHIDMELDINNPPLPLELYVSVFTEEVSYLEITEVAKAIENVLKNYSIPIESYSVRLIPMSDKPKNANEGVSWVNSIAVNDFPNELMSEKNLPQVMENYELSNTY